MANPSVMSHSFSRVPKAEIQRSTFDRSHGYKTTFDSGYLVPVFIDEVLPGDTFNLSMSAFARLATPLKPVMDNLFLESFFFFVPTRIVWDNWKKFNGEQASPADSTSYVVPQMVGPVGPGILVGSLSDYFGIPTGIASLTFNSLFHRCYNRIWQEWFRDENLQNAVTLDVGDGPDTYGNYVLLRRGKRHDYFTSCLPWPQKGTAVSIPLGTSAPVYGPATVGSSTYRMLFQNYNTTDSAAQFGGLAKASGSDNYGEGTLFTGQAAGDTSQDIQLATAAQYTSAGAGYAPPIADLSLATAATINSLRQAFQLQRLYERDARGGTRYYEILKSHFGVHDPGNDVLDRPVFLGGGSSMVNIHPVPQTSPLPAAGTLTPQGNLSAFGTAAVSGHGFTKSFTEHGHIVGLVSVRADLTYQQGLNKMFSRRTRFDFYWPALAQIGEQSVLQGEIYADGTANDAIVFGYQERYAEYRYKPSQITGQFRSTYATTLDVWHLSQKFTSAPTLGNTFISDTPPVARVIAVPTEPQFLFDSYFKLKCARPMPVFGVPGMIDHF